MLKKSSNYPHGAYGFLLSYGRNFLNKNFRSLGVEDREDILSISIQKTLNKDLFFENYAQKKEALVKSFYSKILRGEACRYIDKGRAENRRIQVFDLHKKRPSVDPFDVISLIEIVEKCGILFREFLALTSQRNHIHLIYMKFKLGLKYAEISTLTGMSMSNAQRVVCSTVSELVGFFEYYGINSPICGRVFLAGFFKYLEQHDKIAPRKDSKTA